MLSNSVDHNYSGIITKKQKTQTMVTQKVSWIALALRK